MPIDFCVPRCCLSHSPVSEIITTDNFDIETAMGLVEPELNLNESDGDFVAAVVAAVVDADAAAAAAAAPHAGVPKVVRHRVIHRRFLEGSWWVVEGDVESEDETG